MPRAERPGVEPSFGRYRVVAKLRSGPITDLYRAEQVALGRPVFIKALGPGIPPGSPFAAALEREARLLTELDHPGVIRLLDFVSDEAAMWLVLEYVDGFTLEEVLAKKGKLSPGAAVAVALVLAQALGHAHEHGIVHRDVQPHNVLVSRDGAVKLVNFAAAADERLPTAPELLDGSAGFGTPAYMSPEQLLGEPEDARSDLFSLGIVIHEMLTGKRPFDAPNERAASHRVRHDPVPPLNRTVPEISGALDRAVRRSLAKMPSDRQASAAELAALLRTELDETGFGAPADAIVAEFSRLGLIPKAPGPRRDPALVGRNRRSRSSVGSAAAGYLALLCLIVAGGAAIEYSAGAGHSDRVPHEGARLELVPPRMAFLRVVADPWAQVIVDGQQIDTTPFARAIPLPAGVHYVRLEHPNAPVERRTVSLGPGETVLLDVKMDVPRSRAPRPEASATPSLTDPSTP
jgi:serine/threonine-protein kinase